MAGIDQNTLWQLASMILGKSKAQPTTRERATFLRTDPDGTQWVRLPSSNDETPVNGRTLATAKAGDTVEWSIHDGRLSITGNESQPSVGMREVFQTASDIVQPVVVRISKVNELATLSKNVADAAQQVANAVNQHFFSDTNGVHVTEATQEDWNESHEGANVLLNAAGQLFRDGLMNLLTLTTQGGARALTVWDGLGNAASNIRAIIGETITLGPIGSVRMILSASDMALVNEGNDEIFSIDSGSTGSATVAMTASLVTWSTTASVDTTAHSVSDTGTAAGTTTVTATINGSDYVLASTYATATVTAGTGVSVSLTSAGVTYVQGLMVVTVDEGESTVTTTYPCELSVEYQHTVTDKATMSLMGSQTIGGEGDIIYMVNDKWSSTRNTSTLIRARNAATGREVKFGVATDGRSRGVWDSYKRSWLIHRDANDKTVIGGPNFSVDASGYVKSNGETVNGGLLVNNGWAKNRITNWSSSNQKNVFWWSENTATGERLGFGIADSGYNRGIWDSAKNRWIVVKSQSDVVSYYGLYSNFEQVSYSVVSGATINAGDQKNGTTAITRSGMYPLGVVGWTSNSRFIVPVRFYISDAVVGSGTINWLLYNLDTNNRTPTVNVVVLWVRGN